MHKPALYITSRVHPLINGVWSRRYCHATTHIVLMITDKALDNFVFIRDNEKNKKTRLQQRRYFQSICVFETLHFSAGLTENPRFVCVLVETFW